MNKKSQRLYSLLAIAILIQLVTTVCTLSQNIAYGQQIRSLEIKKQQLLSEESQLKQLSAEKIAIHQLASDNNFTDIQELALVKSKHNALASR